MPLKKKTPLPPAPDFTAEPLPSVTSEEKASKKNGQAKNGRRDLKRQLAKIYAEASLARGRSGRNNANSSPTADLTPPLPSRRKVKILVGLLVFFAFLAAVSWAGFFLFGAGQKFSEENIKVDINAPDKILAGQDITYRLHYANKQKIALANGSLEVRYPDNFQFISANPAPSDKENRAWDLGSLGPYKEGLIEINGKIFGAANSDLTLRAFFNYKPANFNADFQKITTFATHLDSWPLDFVLTGPDELTAGEKASYQISLLNKNENPLNNLEISLTAPPTFKIESLEPALAKDKNLWKIPVLNSQASSTFKIKGSFSAETIAGPQLILAVLNLREGNNLYQQAETSKTTKVSQSVLSLQLAANGTADKQGINFEDKINLAISYENSGETELKDATLRLILDTPSESEKSLLNWSGLEDKNDGAVQGEQRSASQRRGSIIWTKAQIPALAKLKPKDKGLIELSIPVKAKSDLEVKKLSEFKISAYAEAAGKTADGQSSSVQSNTLELILNTDLNVGVQATLKEKKNLPAQIGQTKYDYETTYALAWTLTNSLHEATDLQLTATLPENVDWKNQTSLSAGEISFDETTKQVVWKLNRLPTSAPKVTVSFEVGVKAKEADKGKQGTIIEKTRVEAKDKITGENILFWKDPVMTIL